MTDFSYRIRFRRSPRDTINIDDPEWRTTHLAKPVCLSSSNRDEPIRDAGEWVVVGKGWRTEADALDAGAQCLDALTRTLAALRIGADFGSRAPSGGFFKAGLEMLGGGQDRPVLNDVHGVMGYKSEPRPRLARFGPITPLRGVPPDRFERAFSQAIAEFEPLSDMERVSAELFGASYFQDSADTRFLLLMMAVEALIELRQRPAESLEHVERLISLTKESAKLADSERASLLGTLDWMRNQSIRQAGRELARSRLAGREYSKRSPSTFFTECYDVRSRLVHGSVSLPTPKETGSLTAPLELFVSDLLAGRLLHVLRRI